MSSTITFGLVSIPVQLTPVHKTTGKVKFESVHKDCGMKLKTRGGYTCSDPEHGDIEDEEVVKGYKLGKNQYVVLTDDERDAARTTMGIILYKYTANSPHGNSCPE